MLETTPGTRFTPTTSEEGEWTPTVCFLCVYGQCATRVHVVNGVAVKVEGNPKAPHNLGRLCARGNAIIMDAYDPYRVKVPMKRTNPKKGLDEDPRFVEITWEEALDIIAEKLRAIKEEDPRQYHFGSGMADLGAGSMQFGTAFGAAPIHFFGGVAACGSAEHSVSTWSHNGHVSGYDPDYTDHLVLAGTLSGFGAWLGGASPAVQRVADARVERGMRVVVIDPRCSEAGNKANEWIPIVPGTDLALFLAMLNVMLHELNQFDVEFVKRHTNGPYLIRPDGFYTKESGNAGKPLVWNAATQRAVPFDDPGLKEYVLEGVYEVNGEPCKPAFQLLKERVAPYTPEWAEGISTVPSAAIRRLTADHVRSAKIGATIKIEGVEYPYRPSVMNGYHGLQRHVNGPFVIMALRLLNALVGNYDVPGGNKGWPAIAAHPEIYSLPPPEDGMLELIPPSQIKFPPDIDLQQLYPLSVDSHIVWLNWTLTDPELRQRFRIPYTLKALALCGTNPFRNMGEPRQTEKALKAIDFVFTISVWIDDPALFADVVLPEDHLLERLEPHDYFAMYQIGIAGTMLRQPVVQRMYNTRNSAEIFRDLAERLDLLYGEGGFLDMWNKQMIEGMLAEHPARLDINSKPTWEEITDVTFKARFGEEKGLGWFRRNGLEFRRLSVKEDYHWAPFSGRRFPIYHEPVKELGDLLKQRVAEEYGIDWDTSWYDPLPRWVPCPEHDASKFPPDMDLYVINYKTPTNTHSATASNAWLSELYEADPYFLRVWMNEETGKKKGLRDGDKVWIESLVGKAEGRVKLSQAIHPQVVGVAGAQGSWATNPFAKKGINYASLIPLGLEQINPMLCNHDWCTRVKVTKRP